MLSFYDNLQVLSYTQRFGLGIPVTPIFVWLFARSMLPYKRGKHYARIAEARKITSRTKERSQWKTPVYSKSSRTAVQLPNPLTALRGEQKGVHMARDIYIKMIIALLEKCDDENLLDLIWKILLKCI